MKKNLKYIDDEDDSENEFDHNRCSKIMQTTVENGIYYSAVATSPMASSSEGNAKWR